MFTKIMKPSNKTGTKKKLCVMYLMFQYKIKVLTVLVSSEVILCLILHHSSPPLERFCIHMEISNSFLSKMFIRNRGMKYEQYELATSC